MGELNLLGQYPKTARNLASGYRAEENKRIAKEFGREFFDGDRVNGYGGYHYDGRWGAVARRMKELYGLTSGSSVLDIGCAKGFLLHDLLAEVPGIEVAGLDVSRYALDCAPEDVRPFLMEGTCADLPFEDDSFDVVVAINTIHNTPLEGCLQSLREITRVARRHAFVQVDAWRNERERENLFNWVLTAETLRGADGWLELFREAGYEGDYFWTVFP